MRVMSGVCWVMLPSPLAAAPALWPPGKLASGSAACWDSFAVVSGVGAALSAVWCPVFSGFLPVPSRPFLGTAHCPGALVLPWGFFLGSALSLSWH